MSSPMSFLNLQYNISIYPSNRQTRLGTSAKDQRQKSNVTKIFYPNVEEMRSVFNKFDANKDGKISEEEYKLALRVMGGKNAKLSEIAKAFKEADSNGDGFIDFEEFIKVQNEEGGVKTSDIQGAFRVFDLDGNGKISAEELLEVMRRLGEKSSLNACKKMIRGVDADGDGLINMDEFMHMMTRTMKLSRP
ncbi:hypothetical protein ACH5RR_011428 [Cinchona calisaya]|uniref:EF-hand domain-containing protein n=1 Tax=Cinchona calisaya TaxID=153742 RepID=A0ABD3A8G6_9GENT